MRNDWPSCLPGRAPWIALLASAACLVLVAPARGEIADEKGSVFIKMEAENYSSAFDVGGKPMSVATCDPDASGGLSLEGLDYWGDWILLHATVPAPIVFHVAMRSAEDHYLRTRFIVEFTPMGGTGPVAAADTLNPPVGKGIG